MVKSSAHKCLSCGGPLEKLRGGNRCVCSYCGTVNILEFETKDKDVSICPECGESNPHDANHCVACGLKFTYPCPKCGNTVKTGAEFCAKCGINFVQENQLQEEQDAIYQQQLRLTKIRNDKNAKTTAIILGSCAVIILVIMMFRYYRNNLSPQAHTNQTAIANLSTQGVEREITLLKTQYPKNTSNSEFRIYTEFVCPVYLESTQKLYLKVRFRAAPTSNVPAFWNFRESYVMDQNGTIYDEVVYYDYPSSNNAGTEYWYLSDQFTMAFEFSEYQNIAHIHYDQSGSSEVVISYDITDPAMIEACEGEHSLYLD